jgi:GTP-binding protein HflX
MIEKVLYDTHKPQEKAITIAVQQSGVSDYQIKEYLDELAFLCTTANINVIRHYTQRLERPDSKTYLGKGKIEEIVTYIADNPVDLIICDDDLTPSQTRNLEEIFKCKVLDRSLLILNIFSLRARTSQAKTQVELAQYQYLYPRLTRMWTHLSKQKGGIGMRGPGEKELETDRRIVKDRIAFLKDKLKTIDRQNITRRKQRDKLVRVAIVGYTNVGKSTLMNLLCKDKDMVYVEDKLFATVDSTVRKMVIHDIPFLISDTVGFIRKLPTHLIESFKSTLDEVREADALIHVVDIAHPACEQHIEVVNGILGDLKSADKPTLLVFNKIDLLPEPLPEGEFDFTAHGTLPKDLDALAETYLGKQDNAVVFISAANKENINELRDRLYEMVRKIHIRIYPNYLSETTLK